MALKNTDVGMSYEEATEAGLVNIKILTVV
jgi:hypothetical protein